MFDDQKGNTDSKHANSMCFAFKIDPLEEMTKVLQQTNAAPSPALQSFSLLSLRRCRTLYSALARASWSVSPWCLEEFVPVAGSAPPHRGCSTVFTCVRCDDDLLAMRTKPLGAWVAGAYALKRSLMKHQTAARVCEG